MAPSISQGWGRHARCFAPPSPSVATALGCDGGCTAAPPRPGLSVGAREKRNGAQRTARAARESTERERESGRGKREEKGHGHNCQL